MLGIIFLDTFRVLQRIPPVHWFPINASENEKGESVLTLSFTHMGRQTHIIAGNLMKNVTFHMWRILSPWAQQFCAPLTPHSILSKFLNPHAKPDQLGRGRMDLKIIFEKGLGGWGVGGWNTNCISCTSQTQKLLPPWCYKAGSPPASLIIGLAILCLAEACTEYQAGRPESPGSELKYHKTHLICEEPEHVISWIVLL